MDHIITDPPYEVEAHTKQRRTLKDATQKSGAVNVGEIRRQTPILSFSAIDNTTRDIFAREAARITSRWVVSFCQIEAVAAWRAALTTHGLEWVRGGIWHKPNGMPQFTGDRPGQGFEALAIAHQKAPKRWNGGGRHAFWSINLDHNAGGRGVNDHETKKPERLMLALVDDFTDEDEVIVDPFGGSGTTGAAALRRGRRIILIEKDPKYAALCVERCRAESRGHSLAAERTGQRTLTWK